MQYVEEYGGQFSQRHPIKGLQPNIASECICREVKGIRHIVPIG
jgi:hypothetical protein